MWHGWIQLNNFSIQLIQCNSKTRDEFCTYFDSIWLFKLCGGGGGEGGGIHLETIVNFKQSHTNIFIIALFPPSILSLPHILPPFPFAVRLTFSLVSQHTSSCGLNRKRAEALFFVCKFVVKSLVRSCLLLSNTIDKIVGEGPSTVYFVHLSVQ